MKKEFLIVIGITFLFLGTCITPTIAIDNVKKYSIPIFNRNILYVGGGGPGNYSKIQDAISNASDGDTVFVYNGTYYERIQIGKSINLIGEDKNTTIINGTDNYQTVNIVTNWVNISGFTVEYSSFSTGKGIEIHSKYNKITDNIISDYYWGILIKTSHNTITGNIIRNNKQYGINLARYTHNNTFTSNKITNNQYGIFMYESIYNNFTGNNFSNNRFGIRVRMYSNNTMILNNVVSNNERGVWLDESNALVRDNNILYNDEGIHLYHATNNTILENNISNNGNGIFMYTDNFDNIIKDNTIKNNGNGIYQYHWSNINNTITGNNIISNSAYGIYLHSYSNTVTSNNISNNNRGIYLHSYNSHTITGNSFLNDGIFVRESYHNNVSNNTVNGEPLVFLEDESDMIIDFDAGQIILINCDSITVKNQEISNTSVGIELWNTNNSFITGNTISSNNNYGIYLFSSGNTITDNNISNNTYGIYLYSSSDNNNIYHNNLIDNNINANDGGSNIWNNIYPSGGNYWDDYTGDDDYRGPNQDIHGSDGLGDTAKNITGGGGNEDSYPLMHPWGEQRPVAKFSYKEEYGGYVFNASSSYDIDGDVVFYEWDFDDGTTDVGIVVSHSYNASGEYDVTLTVTDDEGYTGSFTKTIDADKNNPPELPSIDGPDSGKPGTVYYFTFETTDVEGSDIWYFVDWGDDTNTGWLGPYASGNWISENHTWSGQDTYIIRCKAKDLYDSQSDWSDFEIKMPRTRVTFNSLFLWFLERFPVLERLLGLITN